MHNIRHLRRRKTDFLQLFIVSEDFLRCIVKRHMTVVHDNNPLYIFCNILHAVRYEHDRNAARLMQQRKLIEDFIASLRIKACSRLVKHQKIRVHGKHTGNRNTTFLTSGEFKRRFFIHFLWKSDMIQRLFRPFSAFFR